MQQDQFATRICCCSGLVRPQFYRRRNIQRNRSQMLWRGLFAGKAFTGPGCSVATTALRVAGMKTPSLTPGRACLGRRFANFFSCFVLAISIQSGFCRVLS